ncbi:MAG: carbohydrate ABC transporter permease [Firmicutes bacterium]|nr:carbohydrate ABC transporter permease [Bacillota bacterium]
MTYSVLTVIALVVALPLVWMILGSMESVRDMFSRALVPANLSLHNYVAVLTGQPLAHYFFNSFFTTAIIVCCQLLTSSLAAYGIVFTKIRGRYVVFALVIMSLMIPIQSIFIPDYIILSDLRWINTYAALIVPFIGTGFGIFFLRQSYLGIPRTLVESMQMDGATHWTIFRRLVLPNTKAALVTLALLNGVFHYGYLFWPLLVTNTPARWVIPVGLSYYTEAQPDQILWNLLMAANVLAVIPVVLAFLWGQRYLVKGVLAYALKG